MLLPGVNHKLSHSEMIPVFNHSLNAAQREKVGALGAPVLFSVRPAPSSFSPVRLYNMIGRHDIHNLKTALESY